MELRNKRQVELILGSFNLTNFIFKNEIVLILFILPFFKSSGFDYVPGLSMYCNAMLVVETCLFTSFAIIKRRVSPYGITILLYGIWTYGIAPAFSGYNPPSSYYLFGMLAIIAVIDYGFFIDKFILFKTFSDMACIMLTINFIQLYVMPEGFDGHGLYLLGIRTGFSLYVLSGVFLCIFHDLLVKNKIASKTIYCIVISCATLVLKWVATGLTELIILLLFMIFIYRSRKHIYKCWWFSVGAIIINYVIVFLGNTNSFISWFVVDILKKDLSFTGRRDIWDASIRDILASPIFGYGENSSVVVPGLSMTRASHNQWLYYLHESGIVGGLIILISIIIVIVQLEKINERRAYYMLGAFVFITLVAFITEIQCYIPMYYGIFELALLLTDEFSEI